MRTDFPDTKGQWRVVAGFPLLEIKASPATADQPLSVETRPAGFNGVTELQLDSDKAAYQIQHDLYWFNTPAEVTKQAFSMYQPVARLGGLSAEQVAYFDKVDADHALDAGDCDVSLLIGRYRQHSDLPWRPDTSTANAVTAHVVEQHDRLADLLGQIEALTKAAVSVIGAIAEAKQLLHPAK